MVQIACVSLFLNISTIFKECMQRFYLFLCILWPVCCVSVYVDICLYVLNAESM